MGSGEWMDVIGNAVELRSDVLLAALKLEMFCMTILVSAFAGFSYILILRVRDSSEV